MNSFKPLPSGTSTLGGRDDDIGGDCGGCVHATLYIEVDNKQKKGIASKLI